MNLGVIIRLREETDLDAKIKEAKEMGFDGIEFRGTPPKELAHLSFKEYAQQVADQLIAGGIKAIWNFAPVHLDVPAGILVQNENMATSLAVLSVHLQAQMKEEKR